MSELFPEPLFYMLNQEKSGMEANPGKGVLWNEQEEASKEDESSERETWDFVGLGKDSEATERMREGSHFIIQMGQY